MPNIKNFPDGIPTELQGRPSRFAERDTKIFFRGTKEVLFGAYPTDIVEVYIYDTDDNIVAHLNYDASSPALSITRILSAAGTSNFLDVNLPVMAVDLGVTPGRYTMVLNFFHDEVGSESGDRLYIDEISRSRTELRLRPNVETDSIQNQIYEFITPSVPKLYAQALIDEMFNVSIDVSESNKITVDKILAKLDAGLDISITERFNRVGITDSFGILISAILRQAEIAAVNIVANDLDENVQRVQLMNTFQQALIIAIRQGFLDGLIDTRILITG
jgi:hypothetical protein